MKASSGSTRTPTKVNKHGIDKRFNLLFPFLGALFFIIQSLRKSFVLTTPSDPLQYIQPALNPSNGFEFLDRTFLWLYFRLFSLLPIDPELIGPIGTLFINSTLLFFVSLWLSMRYGLVSSSIFIALSLTNPFLISLSTYTYPTQLMTLVIVMTLILYKEIDSIRTKNLVLGIGLCLAVFTKVQAIGVLILFLFVFTSQALKNRRSIELLAYLAGLIIGATFIFLTLVILDGPSGTVQHFLKYFQGSTAKVQFEGQGGVGGFPPFQQYLSEPIYIIAIIGCVLTLVNFKRPEQHFAITAIAQMGTLLSIYFITQRGGSLIHNYTFDFLILGLVCFSIAVGKFLEGIKYFYLIPFSTTIFVISVINNFYSSTHIKYVGQLGIGTPYSTFGWLSFLGFIFFLFALLNSKLNSFNMTRPSIRKLTNDQLSRVQIYALLGFTTLFCSALSNVDRGFWDSTFKVYESQPYHALAKRISSLDGNVCVEVKLDRPEINDSGPRLRGIYETFYAETSRGFVYINGFNSVGESLQSSCDYYVTDFVESSIAAQVSVPVDGSNVVIADSSGNFVASVEIPLRNVG
jgi:hypothetical protein